MSYNLGWGNSVCVREAFIAANKSAVLFGSKELSEFDYPVHEGDPDLIKITAEVIKRQYNLSYRHVFITNGATGGCVIALRAYKKYGYEECITRDAPYYIRYPAMIDASGLKHIREQYWASAVRPVALLDLPSNPLGSMNNISHPGLTQTILDGVYLNNVYMPYRLLELPSHNVLVGSYSKLLGINGIRLGWIATNDDFLAARIKELITSEYCGLSTASQEILKTTLPSLDWDFFESAARFKLNQNREQWSKLEKYFGDTPVKDMGMFYYAPFDKMCQELLVKAGIEWTKGSAMGTDDGFGRINLGQSNQIVEDAVKSFLKADHV